ncbi:hydantoinase/oxoprolinase N-terminal domain-containing protein [Pseudaestuariivita atlantica]|uniref:Hydantoinase n=1 Tax=Pseudaestuariivita atlantica TaxID=1317121 RepID=A0A0L1JPF7_9RHOB|nr:hydantoinase/oxoprolinase family protein [Pseudaestuariivita atlantica]KNG93597.1 hydantoinase [Pseudaestuariivita atlantica]
MALALGVDTGGTYTDAVLIRDEEQIVARAKALTTRPDLARGIGAAVAEVLKGVDPATVSMAALSTTLATNALVEGQGDRVALIAAGFRQQDLDKHGLTDALKGDPVLLLPGKMGHAGDEAEPLDTEALEAWLADAPDVGAFAVAGLFAVRNPAHELAMAEAVARATGRPVCASHQLSAKLNGPKRALTALLNARLVGMIDRLIGQAQARLTELGVDAPLMVVRGDGALVSSTEARRAPIETILSGPAASIVGARWLTGADDALVSDIGGTTTDIAILRGGRPKIDPMGARVGPYRTMVEAVAMRTHGLGGDSEVHFLTEGLAGGVRLGPRRVLPVSLLAVEAPEVVRPALEAQLHAAVPGEHDGRFVRRVPGASDAGLAARDAEVLARIEGVAPLGAVLRKRVEIGSVTRLVSRGIVQVAGVTPSDAAHVLGLADAWDADAARAALTLFGRRRTGAGEPLGDAEGVARIIVDQLTRQTGEVLLESAFAEDGMDQDLAHHPLVWRGLGAHRGAVALDVRVGMPVVGLGASAATWYPAVGDLLGCEMRLPDGAEVANAVGAVVGRVRVRREGTVTAPSDGRFRVHLDTGPRDFGTLDDAMALLEDTLRSEAEREALAAGASGLDIRVTRDMRMAEVEGREMVIEAVLRVEASGRPRIAEG